MYQGYILYISALFPLDPLVSANIWAHGYIRNSMDTCMVRISPYARRVHPRPAPRHPAPHRPRPSTHIGLSHAAPERT